MQPWRHLLLAFALLLAQMVAGAHAVEHAAGERDGLVPHSCSLCLATHDLGGALPSVAPIVFQPPVPECPVPPPLLGCLAWPAPRARQQGPPVA